MESLGKEYSQREKNVKVLRALPPEWNMKVVAMKESKDLSKITTFELFSDLKAFEFDIDRRKDEETSTSKVKTFVAATAKSNQAVESDDDDQDELALFIKQFKKFVKWGRASWKKGQSKPIAEESEDEDSSDSEDNEALICLMAKDEEVNYLSSSSLEMDSP
ncbi:hypothetical protein ACS0TY_032679 [Phlomoides rotata]